MLKTLMHGMHDEIDKQNEVKVIEKVEEKGDDLDLIPEFTGKEAQDDPDKELSKLVNKLKISDDEMKAAANSLIQHKANNLAQVDDEPDDTELLELGASSQTLI